MNYTIYPSLLGDIAIAGTDKGLCFVDFQTSKRPLLIAEDWTRTDAPFKAAIKTLDNYFAGKKPEFKLAYDLRGTPFQLLVWEFLQTIPCGKTLTYSQVAEGIGKPAAVRAVGTAIGRNPITLFIPCHRVIGSNGALTGYAGGLELKAALLKIELP
ncbi:MAG: methylated-DNA--[protein]-cysteine S-methyltransferase [Pseudomonadota bacterium]